MDTTVGRKVKSASTKEKELRLMLKGIEKSLLPPSQTSITLAEKAIRLSKDILDARYEIDSQIMLGRAQFHNGNFQASEQAFRKAFDLLNEVCDEHKMVKVCLYLGQTYPALGDYTSTLNVLNKGIELSKKLGLYKELYSGYVRLADIHIIFSQYAEALECCSTCLETLKEYPDARFEAITLFIIATIQCFGRQFDLALKTYLQLLPLFEEDADSKQLAVIFGNIGGIYYDTGKYELAIKYFNKSLDAYKYNLHSTVLGLANLSRTYIKLGNFAEALKCAEAITVHLKDKDFLQLRLIEKCQLAEVYNCLNLHQKAIESSVSAASLFPDNGFEEIRWKCYHQLSIAYEKLGNPIEALEYHKKYLQVKQDNFIKQIQQETLVLRANLEFQKKEAEKEAYRLKALKLEEELKLQEEKVTQLGLDVIERNEFLSYMKQKAREFLSHANGEAKKVLSFVKEIEAKIQSNDAHDQFLTALNKLHHGFHKKLAHLYPELTASEQKVCSLIKLGLHSQQIAELLFTSIRTVEGHRHNIRKKLNLPSNADIKAHLDFLINED